MADPTPLPTPSGYGEVRDYSGATIYNVYSDGRIGWSAGSLRTAWQGLQPYGATATIYKGYFYEKRTVQITGGGTYVLPRMNFVNFDTVQAALIDKIYQLTVAAIQSGDMTAANGYLSRLAGMSGVNQEIWVVNGGPKTGFGGVTLKDDPSDVDNQLEIVLYAKYDRETSLADYKFLLLEFLDGYFHEPTHRDTSHTGWLASSTSLEHNLDPLTYADIANDPMQLAARQWIEKIIMSIDPGFTLADVQAYYEGGRVGGVTTSGQWTDTIIFYTNQRIAAINKILDAKIAVGGNTVAKSTIDTLVAGGFIVAKTPPTGLDATALAAWYEDIGNYVNQNRPPLPFDGTVTIGPGGEVITVTPSYSELDEFGQVMAFVNMNLRRFFAQNASEIGQFFGSTLGRYLFEDELDGTVASVILGTIGETIGQSIENQLNGYAANQAASMALSQFLPNLRDAGIGAISSYLAGELVAEMGLEGFEAGLTSTVLSTTISTIAINIANGVAWSTGLYGSLANAVASFIGTYLASQLVEFDDLGGQLGSTIGSFFGGMIGGMYGGYLGAAAGAFVGYIVGGLIGSLFTDAPESSTEIRFNEDTGYFSLGGTRTQGGVDHEGAFSVALPVATVVNDLLTEAGSVVAANADVQLGMYFSKASGFYLKYRGDDGKIYTDFSSASGTAVINRALTNALEQLLPNMLGGDVYVKRAALATFDIREGDVDYNALQGNVIVGRDYSTYMQNIDAINAFIVASPDSNFTASWIVVFAQAEQLGLNKRAYTDWLGGWTVFLDQVAGGRIDGNRYSASTVVLGMDSFGVSRRFLFADAEGQIIGEIADTINVAEKSRVVATAGNDVVDFTAAGISGSLGLTVDGEDVGQALFLVPVAAVIDAGAGNDVVHAGALGSDVLGGDGQDVLIGGKLDDWLFGQAGDDVLFSGRVTNSQFLVGDSAAEATALLADGGNGDLLDGGAGSDRLYGGKGSDWLRGGDGADYLVGGQGADILAGGAGDEKDANGNAGLKGGAGSDTYIFGHGDGDDVILDEDGSVSASTADITARLVAIQTQSTAGMDIRDWAGQGQYLVDGTIVGGEDSISFGVGVGLDDVVMRRSGTAQAPGDDLVIELTKLDANGNNVPTGDRLTVKNWFKAANRIEFLQFANGDEVRIADIVTFIVGSGAADIILGTSGSDFVYGGAGNDTIHALQGKDFVAGGVGNDFVTGDSDEDLVLGGVGNDMVGGGGGNDTVLGDRGDDRVYGGAGADILSGGLGNDMVIGGAGDDIVLFKRGDGSDILIDGLVDNWETVATTDAQGHIVCQNGYTLGSDGKISKNGVVYFDGQNWLGTFEYDDATGLTRRHLGPLGGYTAVNAGTDTLEFGIDINIQDLQFERSGDDLVIGIGKENGTGLFVDLTDKIIVKEWFSSAPRSFENFVFAATGVLSTVQDLYFYEGYSTFVGGTDASETITGTSLGEWITGGAGDDVIDGGEGDNLLNGGAGNDLVRATGSAGLNIMYGGAGDDILVATPALGKFFGGQGSDILSFRDTAEAISGFLGQNYSHATNLDSWFKPYTFAMLDSIEGLEGSEFGDFLFGDDNENLIRGLGGADILRGGAGDDAYEFSLGHGADSISEGRWAMEEIVYLAPIAQDDPPATYHYTWTKTTLTNAYRYVAEIIDNVTGEVVFRSYTDFSKTSQYADVGVPLWLDPSSTGIQKAGTISGGWLAEAGVFAAGQDMLDGPMIGRVRPKPVAGHGGVDTLRTGIGIGLSDLTFTKTGNDLVIGIVGTTDQVTIKDQYIASGAINTDKAVDKLQLADGLEVDLTKLVLVGGSASADGDLVVGSSVANTLSGLAGDDVISGAAGNDTLSGGDGNDTLEGGEGADTLDGGGDSLTAGLAPTGSSSYGDTIRYVRSNEAVSVDLASRSASGGHAQGDVISADAQGVSTIENLTGSEGYGDTIWGDGRGNRLSGLGGSDILHGRGGDDVLSGGNGDDDLYGEVGDDNIAGGAGADEAWGGDGKDVLAGGSGDDVLRGENGDDLLTGEAGADTLYGAAGKDSLNGQDGNDILDGGDDDDELLGGAGADTLTGGGGDDKLTGGAGADSLSGGLGDDVYIFDANSDADTVVDASGENHVVINGVTSDQIWLVHSGNDLKIGVIGGTTLITVSNYFNGSATIREIQLQNAVLFLDSATALINAMTTASISVPTTMPQAILDQLPGNWHTGSAPREIGTAKAAPEVMDQDLMVAWNNVLVGWVDAQDDDGDIPATGAYAVSSLPLYGVLTLDADTGAWNYVPDEHITLQDRFFVTVTDAAGHSVEQMVTVNVTAPPAAPTVAQSASQRDESASATSSTTIATLTVNQSGGALQIQSDPLSWFNIAGNQLRLNAGITLNFETLAALPGAVLTDVDGDGLKEFAYTIKVRTSAAGVSSDYASVTYRVEDVNEAPVVTAQALSLAENAGANVLLGTIAATDPDSQAINIDHRFSIEAGGDGAAFSIDSLTGQLRMIASANYEAKSVYTVTVGVRDRAGAGLLGTRTFTVNVTNVNEGPAASSGSFSVAENSAIGAAVGTVTTTDPEAGVLTYSLTGPDAAAFLINPATGEITVNTALNYEVKQSYSVTVRATDAGGLYADSPVTVTVTNVDEAPVVTSGTFSVAENSAVGTAIGTLTTTDPEGATVSYSLTGADADAFLINSSTGAITVNGALNHESKPTYSFFVRATDATGHYADSAVTVNVGNINEAPASSSATLSVAENSAIGAAVGAVTRADPEGTTVAYSLTGPDAAAFLINASTGAITVNSALNTEAKSSYSITVRATDATGLYSDSDVTVNVTNVNEAPAASPATFSINENSAIGAAVGTLTTTDPEGGALTYSLTGTDAAAFLINASTGAITLNTAVNYESKTSYSLNVRATDAGGLYSDSAVTVNVGDVNEAPTISAQGYNLAQTAGSGTVVGTVVSADPDVLLAYRDPRYAISGAGAAGFSIDAVTGVLTTDGSVPLTVGTNPSFTVTVTDMAGTGLSTSNTVTVTIINPPAAPTVTPIGAGLRNETSSTPVTTVASLTSNQSGGTLEIASDPWGWFFIDAGQIKLAAGLNVNFETLAASTPASYWTIVDQDGDGLMEVLYTAKVRTTAGGITSAESSVVYRIEDVNETPVVQGQTISLAEDTALNAVVATILVNDPDTQASTRDHRFSLSGADAAAFTIDNLTGELKLNTAFDFETKTIYAITVTVVDRGGAGLTNSRNFSISVTNVNEAPIVSAQAFSLAENAAVNAVVGTAVSSDPDTSNATFRNPRYSISGTDAAGFAINTTTGQITLTGTVNYEAKSTYSFTLRVTDMGGGGLWTENTVTVNITDGNDAPTISAQTFSTAENGTTGTVIGTLAFSDVDSLTANRNHRFSLSGADAASFAIDAVTGVLTVNGSLDYETKSTYTFTIRVRDQEGTGLYSENTVTVNLTDAFEPGPTTPPQFSMVNGMLTETGSSSTTTVANLTATQTGGAPVLAIASDPWNWFQISGNDLVLKSGLNLDFETLAALSGQGTVWTLTDADNDGLMEVTYQVKVRSSVGATNSVDSDLITFRVEDQNESPTVSAASFSLAENPTAGTVLGAISWSDPDTQTGLRDPRFALSGADAALFAIDATTGQLTVTGVLDYETRTVYTVTVTATDRAGTGLSASNTVTVTVSDANDAPMVAAQTFSVNEKVANNTAVGTVVWSDPDALTANRNPRFAISGDDAAMFNINTTTGAITAKAGLDYETKAVYSFQVTVTDQGGAGASTTQTVTVNLNDVNDAPTLPSQSFSIAENSALNTAIGTATVTDQDALAANRDFRFSLTGTDAAAFAIDNLTGQLTLQTAVNFEAKSSYSINLVVTDQGGAGSTATRAVTVTVADINEAVSVAAQSFSVDENAASSTVVGTVAWTDPDTATTNRNPRFAISGADAAAFRIGSTTGIITVFTSPNYEVKSTYTFTVTVTDKSGTGFAASETITININDLSEGSMIPEPKGAGSRQGSLSSPTTAGVRSSLMVASSAPVLGGAGSLSLAAGGPQERMALDMGSMAVSVSSYAARELLGQASEISDSVVGWRGGDALADAIPATAATDAAQTPLTLPLAPKASEDSSIALPTTVPAGPLAGAAQTSGITVTSASGGIDLGDARPGAINRTATPDTPAQVMRDALKRPMPASGDEAASGRAAQQPWMQAAVQAMGLWKPEWSAAGGPDIGGANPEIDFDFAAAGDARSALDQRLDLQQRNRIKMVNAMAGFAPEGAASLDGGNEKLHDPRAMALLTSLPQHRTGVGL